MHTLAGIPRIHRQRTSFRLTSPPGTLSLSTPKKRFGRAVLGRADSPQDHLPYGRALQSDSKASLILSGSSRWKRHAECDPTGDPGIHSTSKEKRYPQES